MTENGKWWRSPFALVCYSLLGLAALETQPVSALLAECPTAHCGEYTKRVLEHVFVGIVGALVIWQFLERRTFDVIHRAVNHFAIQNLSSEQLADAYFALLEREGLSAVEAKSLASAVRRRVLNLHEKLGSWFLDITLHPHQGGHYLRFNIRLLCSFAQTDKKLSDLALAFWPKGDVGEDPYRQNFLVSWVFRAAPGSTALPDRVFDVTRVRVGDQDLSINRVTVAGDDRIEFRCAPKGEDGSLEGRPIVVDFTVLQARAYGFVAVLAPRMIKELFGAAIDWSNVAEIVDVHPLEMIIGTAAPQNVPPQDGEMRLERRFHGVTAKTSHLIFSWSGDSAINKTFPKDDPRSA